MKSSLPALLLAAMMLSCAPATARAQEARAPDAVVLGTGDQFRLFLQKPFETVMIGDPAIVDVRTDDAQSVLIEPRKAGVTNLVFVDAHGMVVANVRLSICGTTASGACATRQSSL